MFDDVFQGAFQQNKHNRSIMPSITLFRSITTLYGTDNIPHNISHIQTECGKYLGIFCGMLSVSQNIVMNLNKDMRVI